MSRKKQIIVPIVILVAGVVSFVTFSGMKKPPEEKEEIDNTPIVAVEAVTVSPMTLEVGSHGIVKPKYQTDLVAQVSGQIVELSDTFVRGGFVKKGQLLARIDPNDYNAALIDAQATMASARASLETERAQGKVAEREWKRITDTSPTELSLRKPQLAQELARVKAAQASVLRAQRNVERTEIRAPYDAMVESRNIGLGSFVGTGTPIGRLLGTDVAEVRLPVADNQLQFLTNSGNNAEVELKGSYAGKAMIWNATIARSEGVIDNTSRMSYLVAQVVDPYGLKNNDANKAQPLRFGSYVNADILGASVTDVSVIPRHLVNEGRVAIFDKESRLHYADIRIVRQQGGNVVASGLIDGDQLIVSALDYPVDGMKLSLGLDDESDATEEESDSSETQVASNDSTSGE